MTTTTTTRPNFQQRKIRREATMTRLVGTAPPVQRAMPGDALTTMAMSRRAFTGALMIACPQGHGGGGIPCWELPSDQGDRGGHGALCGPRCRAVFQRWTSHDEAASVNAQHHRRPLKGMRADAASDPARRRDA